jgi:hypothetical protein
MDCAEIEQKLSEYMEASLPTEEMGQVTAHLEICTACSQLLHEMQSALNLCRSFPILEMDLELVEKILLRTSGRPRHRSLGEILRQYFSGPLLSPRFAVGAGLAVMFVALMVNLMIPRVTTAVSTLSPSSLFRMMDRGVQKLYGEGLKAYDTANGLQAEYTSLKLNVVNKFRSLMEQMDVPVENSKKTNDPGRQKEKPPKERSSGLQLILARNQWDSVESFPMAELSQPNWD